jgi:hypothetical protein
MVGLYAKGFFEDFSFLQRLQTIGSQGDDSADARGYDVVFESNAIEIIIGMGSDKVEKLVGHEVHSTIFSYLASYGFIGGGLFIAAMLSWMYTIYRAFGPIGVFLVVLPSMLYGITHNGSRFTLFWILISLSFGLASSHSVHNVNVNNRYMRA